MRQKICDMISIILFCGFLLTMALCYLFSPKRSFSEAEKRYLSEFPALEWNSIASGQWGNDIETYLADHIPARDLFIGLNAYYDLYTGRQVSKDIWLVKDRLLEAPVTVKESQLQTNLKAIATWKNTINCEIDFMLIPSAGWATGNANYTDDQIVSQIYSHTPAGIRTIDTISVFINQPDYYFKTDHHWNSDGAYAAYRNYMEYLDRNFISVDDYTIESHPAFYGSTYSRSALWLTPAENLEIWLSNSSFSVTNGESEETHNGLFYFDRLSEADKYTVFLDGNHSIVQIKNPNATGKILVIRDSFSNLLGCFLAESYGEVIMVDLRYYKQPVSQLLTDVYFDNILVCYSLSNFLTDTNLVWLR